MQLTITPWCANTPQTMNLLAKAGIKYTLDLLIDDQPQPVLVKEGKLISVPYSLEVNDWTSLHIAGAPPREYTRIIKAQFDQLLAMPKRDALLAMGKAMNGV